MKSAVVNHPDGHMRNCCKRCNVACYAYDDNVPTHPASSQWGPGETFPTQKDRADAPQSRAKHVEWLKDNITLEFWKDVEEQLDKKLIKHVSRSGAVRMPINFPRNRCHWTDCTGQYYDVGNKVYGNIFKACWPAFVNKTGKSNDKKLGDLVEFILAMHWSRAKRQLQIQEKIRQFIIALEAACLADAILDQRL